MNESSSGEEVSIWNSNLEHTEVQPEYQKQMRGLKFPEALCLVVVRFLNRHLSNVRVSTKCDL